MSTIYLGLGTNEGDRQALLQTAVQRLASLGPVAVSPCYETAPIGLVDQPDFWNVVVRLETDLSPEALLGETQAIENALGRVRSVRWGPRTMDIDILLYDNVALDTPDLTIPHPRLHERAFVLQPLLDLWPEAKLPNEKPLAPFLTTVAADQSVRPLYVSIGRQSVDKEKLQQAVRMLLEAIGEDPEREGLLDTPRRVAAMYEEICSGIAEDAGAHLELYFSESHEEIVLVRDISFYSICEHHLVPFFGKAHVAYLPRQGRLTGLSKMARLIETLARRPQLQERLTSTAADLMVERLQPHGVMVVVEAEHMCMTMRGIRKPGSSTVTSAVRGLFAKNAAARAEAMSLITKQ